jgi:hypothetical protein
VPWDLLFNHFFEFLLISLLQMPPVGPVAWDLLFHPRVQDLSLWAVQRNIDMVQKKKKGFFLA